jgi:hypothetical protein
MMITHHHPTSPLQGTPIEVITFTINDEIQLIQTRPLVPNNGESDYICGGSTTNLDDGLYDQCDVSSSLCFHVMRAVRCIRKKSPTHDAEVW